MSTEPRYTAAEWAEMTATPPPPDIPLSDQITLLQLQVLVPTADVAQLRSLLENARRRAALIQAREDFKVWKP